jgi:hypothetical protein
MTTGRYRRAANWVTSSRIRPARSIVVFVVTGALLQGSWAQTSSIPSPASMLPVEVVKQTGTTASRLGATVPSCSISDSPRVPELAKKAKHSVILSWTASAPADSRHADAVGYCIFRTLQGRNQPKLLVNSQPFFQRTRQLSCKDDLVENGKRYIYVVRAISANNKQSDPSNVASAVIPTRKASNHSERSVSLCRNVSEK